MFKIRRSNKSKEVLFQGVKQMYTSIAIFYEELKKHEFLLEYKYHSKTLKLSANLTSYSKHYNHLLLYNSNLVQEFKNSKTIFIDISYEVQTNIVGAKALMSIMAEKNNLVRIQLYYIFFNFSYINFMFS